MWKEIVQKYISRHSDKIKKTTRPLLSRFGIEYFTYHRINKQGQYTVLVDRPDWAENYVSEKFYEQDPYLRDPSVYRSGASFWDHHGTEEYKQLVQEAGIKRFHWDLGLILIEKTEDGVEFFGFSANRKSSCLEQLYLNQSGILKQFGNYFKQELASTLKKMDETGFSLPTLKGKDFHTKQPIIPSAQNHRDFLSDIGITFEPISPAEQRCLKYLLEGYSAKEMADALFLSPRTIESHLESLKGKLGCSTKRELFLRVKYFAKLGLII